MLDKITAYSTLALAITGALALGFAYDQIRESHHQAQIQHLVEAVHEFQYEDRFLSYRRTLAKARIDPKTDDSLIPLNPDNPPREMYELLDYFDYLGLLEKRGYLDKQDVWDQFGNYLFDFYADARPVIYEEQQQPGGKVTWDNLTQMMADLERIDARNDHAQGGYTAQSDLRGFYDDELIVQPGEPLPQGKRKKK